MVLFNIIFCSHTDNTEIIINSVIVLFVCHLDELLYELLNVFPWLLSRISQAGQNDFDVVFGQNYWEATEQPQEALSTAKLTEDVSLLIQKFKLLEEHCPDLKKLPDLVPVSLQLDCSRSCL